MSKEVGLKLQRLYDLANARNTEAAELRERGQALMEQAQRLENSTVVATAEEMEAVREWKFAHEIGEHVGVSVFGHRVIG